MKFRSKERKCTKPQICSAGVCTWNQRLTFFDIDTLDHLSIWIRFVDLDRNEDILGEVILSYLLPISFHLPRSVFH